MNRHTLLLIAGLSIVQYVSAEDQYKQLVGNLQGIFKDVEITSISPAPIEGLYEVMMGPNVLYISSDGRYVLEGDLFDLQKRTNISDHKRALERKRIFSNLPAKDVVEFSPNRPQSTLYVYTDIDCGYCRKLHREVPELNDGGIAVRYLAFPRSGLDSDSFKKAAAVWCSADKQKAMTEAKQGKPVDSPNCRHPVAEQFELGKEMGVAGTPTIYTAEGKEIGGYVPAASLIQMYEDGKL
jgi:thiol:disulfide interchange protein DsbC